MGYHDYGRYLSFHFPFTHERALLEHLRACPWNFDQSLFKVWLLVLDCFQLVSDQLISPLAVLLVMQSVFAWHDVCVASHFQAWRQGSTGYPLVDAGMLELWSTGWMHNRLRVVCASFLVKNLLLPWQWGLKHFWDALLDADVESDALGFQYVSGCLLDAHPFRWAR